MSQRAQFQVSDSSPSQLFVPLSYFCPLQNMWKVNKSSVQQCCFVLFLRVAVNRGLKMCAFLRSGHVLWGNERCEFRYDKKDVTIDITWELKIILFFNAT